jgi:hypothetical protein
MIPYEDITKHYIEKILPSNEFLLNKPCKNLELLLPAFRELIEKLTEKFNLFIVETYRSNALQQKYYSIGASKIKINGMHHFGTAIDVCFIDDFGTPTYRGNFAKLHEAAESLGLPDLGKLEIWDAGHFQFIPIENQHDLRDIVKQAVKVFQAANNLVIDGIAGNKTHAKAVEVYG